jgi:hypothetical protein
MVKSCSPAHRELDATGGWEVAHLLFIANTSAIPFSMNPPSSLPRRRARSPRPRTREHKLALLAREPALFFIANNRARSPASASEPVVAPVAGSRADPARGNEKSDVLVRNPTTAGTRRRSASSNDTSKRLRADHRMASSGTLPLHPRKKEKVEGLNGIHPSNPMPFPHSRYRSASRRLRPLTRFPSIYELGHAGQADSTPIQQL